MSITQLIDRTAISPKIKQFFWDVKDNRNVGRGIGGYYTNDKPSTPYSTTNTTATVVAQYTFTAGAGTNYIRVRVYGYVGSGTGYFAVIINGTNVTGYVSTTSTTNVLLIDYLGSLTPNTSYTVQISAYVSGAGAGASVSQVTIIAGFGLTSTASTTILTINLDPANDTYTLNVTGNFVYQVGIRWWAKGNRKTTATATIQSNLVSEIQGYYSPIAADDGDSNVFLTVRTGNYATSFTISGNVGASGDVIIIMEIYCQIVLRGNNPDSLNNFNGWTLLIKENGIMSVISRHVTIDGSSQLIACYLITSNGYRYAYQSPSASDLTVSDLVFATNNSPECVWHIVSSHDTNAGISHFLYINIIIIGA